MQESLKLRSELKKSLLNNKYKRVRKKIDRTLGIKTYKYKGDEYAGKKLIDRQSFNEELKTMLYSGKPFMVARFGSNEILNIIEYYKVRTGISKKMNEKLMNNLYFNAGVFPMGQEMSIRFSEYMISLMQQVDILGAWLSNCEDFLIKKHMTQTRLTKLENLEPYYADEPWSKALEGKKMLVVHPFEETIRRQYEKREFLFDNKDILPSFDLRTYKAIQTIAGNNDTGFADWFEALDHMYEDIIKIDFDIAILGCGAYGFPLAARLKRAGKQAIHLGGATQILFGIKGSRWDGIPAVSSLYNKYWTRPLDVDKPTNASKIEDGCYW